MLAATAIYCRPEGVAYSWLTMPKVTASRYLRAHTHESERDGRTRKERAKQRLEPLRLTTFVIRLAVPLGPQL